MPPRERPRDRHERVRIEAGAADERAVDVWQRGKLRCVASVHAPAVQQPDLRGRGWDRQPGEVRCVLQITGAKRPGAYSFALRDPRIGITWQPFSRSEYTKGGAQWTFSGVAPGEVEALFRPSDDPQVRKVTVVAGQTAEVRFRWPP